MVKKILITLFTIFFTLVVGLAYEYYNFKVYSIYYAQHTPHKPNVEPVLMEMVDNMQWINHPADPDIEFRHDGGNIIYNENYNAETTPVLSYGPDESYLYISPDGSSYYFYKQFQVISAWDAKWTKINPDNVNRKALKQEIYSIFQPVIDAQDKPLINLQWLYDHANKNKFN